MRRSTHWLVADHGIRPQAKPDRCLYCDAEMGQEHNEGCIIRRRTVVVKFEVSLVVDVPETWTPDQIQFRYNEFPWCGNKLIKLMVEAADRMDSQNLCLCPAVNGYFEREATEDDEKIQAKYVNELPS